MACKMKASALTLSETTVNESQVNQVSSELNKVHKLAIGLETSCPERLYIWDGDEAQETPQRWINKDSIHGVSPSDYTVVSGYGIKGYIERAGAYPRDSAQRATSIDSIIIGDFDGKTLGLTSYTLSSGATVNYGIWYGYINPNTNAFNGTQYVEEGTDDVYVYGKWLDASITLPTNNNKVGKRFLIMAFKIANATRDFTQAELKEIPTLINIS